MVNCAVIGATSFTGGELIRILARHPYARIVSLTTRSEEPVLARELVPALGKKNRLKIEKLSFEKVLKSAEVVFLTLPHAAGASLAGDFYDQGKVVIDLSADFRLKQPRQYERWYEYHHPRKDLLKKAVYGLPELYRGEIQKANLIANPGCYPTAAILGLYPLLKEKLIDAGSITIDAKSGVSGAGKKLSPGTQFSEVNENFYAYKVGIHQHTPEINQVLGSVGGGEVSVAFVTHLLPVYRGILSTMYAAKAPKARARQIVKAFEAFAGEEPFVQFLGNGTFPSLKTVQNTNHCAIGVSADDRNNRVIVISAIDNLLKGASGQAVQNMNIRMGFPETAGFEG